MLLHKKNNTIRIAGERQGTSEMQNLFFSTGEGDTIAQDSRCKSSLSEAATFWLASSGCPFASARLRNILSHTVFKYFFSNLQCHLMILCGPEMKD